MNTLSEFPPPPRRPTTRLIAAVQFCLATLGGVAFAAAIAMLLSILERI